MARGLPRVPVKKSNSGLVLFPVSPMPRSGRFSRFVLFDRFVSSFSGDPKHNRQWLNAPLE